MGAHAGEELAKEGVRARTSTTFNSADADDGAAEEEEEDAVVEFTAPESERRATPSVSAGPEGGDDDLERGTASTTFKVGSIDDDVDEDEDGVNAEEDVPSGEAESEEEL